MRDNNMELFDKDVKVTKTVLYPLDRSARRGINKFGILLSDYNSYEDYKKALTKIQRKMYRSLPSYKYKKNLSRRNPEYREKHNLYLREWRAKNPERMALANLKDKIRKRKRYRELKDNI
tara:strand:- start:56 stop:415 length:360 start_codon:yes stop_codon:yes gene_type:complete